MEMQRTMSEILTAIKTSRNLSLTELSDYLEISRSRLCEILKQNANLRIDTVEHIAAKLGVDPAILLAAPFDDTQLKVISLLLELTGEVYALPPEKRRELAQAFLEVVRIWASEI